MKGYVDLHTHSTASDGSMEPAELVLYASKSGIDAMALTDHDTVDGLEEALEWGKKTGLEVLAGVEISAEFEGQLHFLGYFPDDRYRQLDGVLADLRRSRYERNPKIVEKLKRLGINISMDEVEREATGNITGRSHIARVLMKKGYVESIKEAFDKFLGEGKPAYVEKEKLSPRESIAAISNAGGIPVLAHPGLTGLGEERLERLVAEWRNYGLMGIECHYVEHSQKETEFFLGLARKYGLIVTGGSDFHGSFKPDIDIGRGKGNLKVPRECFLNLKAAFAVRAI